MYLIPNDFVLYIHFFSVNSSFNLINKIGCALSRGKRIVVLCVKFKQLYPGNQLEWDIRNFFFKSRSINLFPWGHPGIHYKYLYLRIIIRTARSKKNARTKYFYFIFICIIVQIWGFYKQT